MYNLVQNARGLFGAIGFSFLVFGLSSCSPHGAGGKQEALVPDLVVQVPPALSGTQDVPAGQNDPNGLSEKNEKVRLTKVGSQIYIHSHGVYSDQAFEGLYKEVGLLNASQKSAVLENAIQSIAQALKNKGAIVTATDKELGWITFLLPLQGDSALGLLKGLRLSREMLFSPDWIDYGSLKQAKAFRPEAEGLTAAPATDTSEYSGLKRMGVFAFIRNAERDIRNGAAPGSSPGDFVVNGSAVRVGITDTGITYNHPTFLSALDRSKNRIDYMKDYTREGRVYFNPKALFAAKEDSSQLGQVLIDAQVLQTPRSPSVPFGEEFKEIKDFKVVVPSDLKALLLDASSGVKLGFLREDAFQEDAEKVDINANGKLDDEFPMIYVPAAAGREESVYCDFSAKGDFTKAVRLREFNSSGDTTKVFAERIGFSFSDDELARTETADAEEAKVKVRGVSIVGYDPGNHGSHVAGISSGSKTIQNDTNETAARGVAPESQIAMNRVCANNGGCNALEAFVDLAKNAAVDVINMSLGGLSGFNDGYGTQETMINRLTSQKNVLFVISAGNSGPGHQTVGSPSVARLSLSVGAAASRGLIRRQYQWPGGNDDGDMMLFFSSRGPTAAGGFKPNLAAPGTELSSVQLNAAPGSHAGLDVYWGTSMAAPSATGAYALFVDAIRKYNKTHPSQKLPTDVLTLRQVLISSARPFDVNRFDPSTGEGETGQYTWIDEGTGMVDLAAAWKLLFKVRDRSVPTAIVTAGGEPVEVDYQVITSQKSSPSGQAYDGSRPGQNGPAFGSGLYLNANAPQSTLLPVYIARRLPAKFAATDEVGDLTRDLETTQDEFELRTVFYGSAEGKVEWLKSGVLNQIPATASNCDAVKTGTLKVTSLGVTVSTDSEGKGTINPLKDSTLNVCVDREKIAALSPGDHGALIEGYRVVRTESGRRVRSEIPAFTVPVYLNVPQQKMMNQQGYLVSGMARSFDVKRHTVFVPEGTTVVSLSLEVPPVKMNSLGIAQGCSGVELMALLGENTAKPFANRADARVANCSAEGAPFFGGDDKKRTIHFSKHLPKAGWYDLDVFGSYAFEESAYTLRVEYVKAASTIAGISGDLSALKGSFEWELKEASLPLFPDAASSKFELNGFYNEQNLSIKTGEMQYLETPSLGALKKFPASITAVRVSTGGSPGNDLDLAVLECPESVTDVKDKACKAIKTSAGSTDVESIEFKPDPKKGYAYRVEGFELEHGNAYVATEELSVNPEQGVLSLSGLGSKFTVDYDLPNVSQSKILNDPWVTQKLFKAKGSLRLLTTEGALLESLDVRVGY